MAQAQANFLTTAAQAMPFFWTIFGSMLALGFVVYILKSLRGG